MPHVAEPIGVTVIPARLRPLGERLRVITPIVIERYSVLRYHPSEISVHNIRLLDHKKGKGFGQGPTPMKTLLVGLVGSSFGVEVVGRGAGRRHGEAFSERVAGGQVIARRTAVLRDRK